MASSGIKHDFLDPPKDADGALGSLGHYRVLRELGKGGMGYVFLAEDSRLKRQVALKVMNAKIAATPGSRKRFISEARSMAAVHHDNVATIFEVGEHKGTPFMAMELLEGATLENYYQEHGEPDYHQIISFARDIAKGLGAAHAQGIVHRDIKPANIWLDTKTNRIKILDFGLALASTPVDQLSGRGAVVGTPGYLSPEQARSEPLDDRCDLYCAGVVLYEMATGSLPLKTKTVAEQLIAILAHAPKPLRERNDRIPQPLADLIHRLMAKEPRDRYRSANALEKALDEVEVECEKKSEVAQAISQLQLGLEQAVNRKNRGGDLLDLDATAASLPNPFDALPDVMPAAAPLTIGVGASGLHSAVPVGGASRSTASATKTGSSGTIAGSNSKMIWIVVGIAAVVLLLAIPTIVFLSDSSAIARQQNEATIIVSENANADQSPRSNSSSAVSNRSQNKNESKPAAKPNAQNATANSQSIPPTQRSASGDKNANNSTTLITKVDAKVTQGVGGQGVKYLISQQQNNGSFEEGDAGPGQTKIPSWTAKVSGKDGGWGKAVNARNADAQTYAYAGAKSELVLTSDPLKHQTQAGDTFRISVNTGGNGDGMTDYRIVLGFQGDSGPAIRYQLAELANDAKWGGGTQAKVIYEYTVDASVAGKQPFVELTVSNANRFRKRGMLDRVVLTVDGKSGTGQKSIKSESRPVPNASVTPLASVDPQAMKSDSPPSMKPAAQTAVSPASLRTMRLTTAEDLGADATVKRGGSSNEPLGEKPQLVIQTRNDRQIQHVYMRFALGSLRADGGPNPNNNRRSGGQKNKPLPVATVELSLRCVDANRPGPVKLRVYGISDPVSDVWPESKIVWSNSFSSEGLDKLPLLAEQEIGPDDLDVVITGKTLTEFVAAAGNRSVTLILTGSTGEELVSFASKEDESIPPPALLIGLTE